MMIVVQLKILFGNIFLSALHINKEGEYKWNVK